MLVWYSSVWLFIQGPLQMARGCKTHCGEFIFICQNLNQSQLWNLFRFFSCLFYQWMKSTGKNSSLVFYSSYTNFACHGKMHFLILKKLFIYDSDTDMCRLSYSQLDSCNSLFFRYHPTSSISLPKPQRFATFGLLK